MDQRGPESSGSRRSRQLIAPVVFLTIALAATALVTWLVVATGLETWVFLVLLATVVFVVLAFVD